MTNQFTDEQLLAALNASQRKDREQVGTLHNWIRSNSLGDWHPDNVAKMRAALEAAAGVAPQAPPRINRDKLVAVIDAEAGSYDPVTSGCGYHASLKLADDSDMAERIADKVIRAAIVSVQPSSTVDEARAWDEGYWQGINGRTGPGNPHRADKSTAPRAVVEAIGGESRGE